MGGVGDLGGYLKNQTQHLVLSLHNYTYHQPEDFFYNKLIHPCISFPRLLLKMYPKQSGLNRNVWSQSSGGWKFKVKVLAGLVFSEDREQESVPGHSPGF